MMATAFSSHSYEAKRGSLETYFDRTARDAWTQLTSEAPVGRIRATVRAGRTMMRDTLLSWLPDDLSGRRILDAGCGTGALAVAAAERGAEVVAIDVAKGLVDIARQRAPAGLAITWCAGDMLDPALGRFDHVVAMDSLIHYDAFDMVAMIARLGERASSSLLFTFAPSTRPLMAMHAVGKLFPRTNRAPAIEPVGERLLRGLIAGAMPASRIGRIRRVASGFYTSQALEIVQP